MNRVFYKNLRNSMERYGADVDCAAAADQAAGNVKSLLEKKSRREPLSYPFFLWSQLRFTGMRVWGGQAAVLLLLCFMVNFSLNGLRAAGDMPRVFCLLGIAAAASAMTGIPCVCRSLRYRMYEMECASRISWIGLQAARLLLAGTGNAVMLAVLFGIARFKETLPIDGAIYMILPFTLVWAGSFFIIKRSRGTWPHLYCLAFGAGVILLLFFLENAAPWIFAREMAPAWGIVCIVVLAGVFRQAAGLLRHPAAV